MELKQLHRKTLNLHRETLRRLQVLYGGAEDQKVEKTKVVAGPRGRMGRHPEAPGDTAGDGSSDVAQDAVEIETTQHVDEVIDGV